MERHTTVLCGGICKVGKAPPIVISGPAWKRVRMCQMRGRAGELRRTAGSRYNQIVPTVCYVLPMVWEVVSGPEAAEKNGASVAWVKGRLGSVW